MSDLITEDQAALRLGVERDWLKQHRGPSGGNWEYGPNRRVMWKAEAVDALVTSMAGKMGTPAALEPSPQAFVVLVVTHCRFPNKRVLEASVEGADPNAPRAIVQVTNARRFEPGMKILGRPRPGRPAVFDYAGNPAKPDLGPVLPIRPGVWR